MNLLDLKDHLNGRLPWGVSRSPEWRVVEKKFKAQFPICSACGTYRKIEVHHIIPFHLDPSKELDYSNLVSLCHDCHFFLGHLKSWKSVNKDVLRDAVYFLTKIKQRMDGLE